MKQIEFSKVVGSGNDFVIVRSASVRHYPLSAIAKKICDRKFGIGADGLLVLEKADKADCRMRIFNADGSEAQMCGNGARCVAFYLGRKKAKLKTMAGIIETRVSGDKVRIKLTEPRELKVGIPIKVNGRTLKVNFVNTGVPHAVIFTEGLDKIDVFSIGRQVRYHKRFAPAGTNVNFVEIAGKDTIAVRTYERGVEDETLACGTGSVASAIITAYSLQLSAVRKIMVRTRGREVLNVYFKNNSGEFSDVWLEGKVRLVYKGVYYV